MNLTLEQGFSLGEHTILPSRNLVTGDAGDQHLEPKTTEVLLCLAAQANEVVSREAIIEQVWPRSYAGDDALNRCISLLRQSLGDDRTKPRFIETIPKRGYRLLMPPYPLPAAHGVQAAGREAAAASLAELPMPGTGLPSIAVLPFANLSSDADREFLADGITDEIVTMLSQLPDIFIISHNSVLAFKNRNLDVRAVAEELCVRYILQGSVHQIGQRIRVTAQLVEASSGAQLWANKYDGEEETIFDMQDHVSEEIVSIMGGEIMRKEIQRISRHNPDNLDAWGHYVHAQDFYYRQSQQHLKETIEYAQKAIDKDPNFSQAYSLLAVALSVLIITRASENPESDTERCVSALERALMLAPDHPRILAECANTNANLSHARRAIDLAKQAVERGPCFAGAISILGLTHLALGNIDEAVHYIKKAQACSPRDSQMSMWLYWMSWAFAIKGEFETALDYVNRSIERNPEGFLAWISKTNIEGELDRLDDARKSLARTRELLPILTLDVAVAATNDFFATPELARAITSGLAKAGLE